MQSNTKTRWVITGNLTLQHHVLTPIDDSDIEGNSWYKPYTFCFTVKQSKEENEEVVTSCFEKNARRKVTSCHSNPLLIRTYFLHASNVPNDVTV